MKLKTLYQIHENNFIKASKYFNMQEFDAYNPLLYKSLLTDWSNGKVNAREFLSRILDIEKEQSTLIDNVCNVIGDVTNLEFIDTWALTEEMILLATPYREKRFCLIETLEPYTHENSGAIYIGGKPTKDEILDYLLDDSEEGKKELLQSIKEYEEMNK